MNSSQKIWPVNLGDLVSAEANPLVEVLIDSRTGEDKSFGARKLRELVQAFARGLVKRGLGPGSRVAFLSFNRWELVVGYLGTMYCGAIAVPLNHKLPGDIVAAILEDANAELVFYDRACATHVPSERPAIPFDGDNTEFENFLQPGRMEPYNPTEEAVAEILYTSGSTGLPKGVPLTHVGQLWALSQYQDSTTGPAFGKSTLIVAPMYHMNALFFLSTCLLNQLRVVLLPTFDAQSFVDAAVKYRCSMLSGVPTMFALVAALRKDRLPTGRGCVETISVGSAPLSGSLLKQIKELFPKAEVSNGYGSTEAGPAIFGPHPDGLPKPPLSIGYLRTGVDAKIVEREEETNAVTEADMPGSDHKERQGRLLLRTPAMAHGYLNREEATAEKFSGGWFDTGDIVRRDGNGFFYFLSRADDMFVCGGENIYPAQVESLLLRHNLVRDAVVVGVADHTKGMVPVAFVVLEDGERASEDMLKDHCLEHGPAYAHPRGVIIVEQLPVSGTHKIDRRTLGEQAEMYMLDRGRVSGAAT